MKTIKDKTFVRLIDKQKIQKRIQELADKISKDFDGKNPIFLGVLNGSFMFLSDLMKNLEIECQMSFLKVNSYKQLSSSGTIKELIGINEDLENRHVIIVEDIVDSGRTMAWIINTLEPKKVASIHIASLLLKPKALQIPIKVDYCGFEIENDFVLGYGLDYDGYGRNIPEIMVLKS
ncbi:hypoxanthine phosphoribosyltransferase [Spirosomataceae bacterium TFI 002]|nr:hypoxanthine phosphoribosyltransferase [Spirosomataceae bacterium TFI 002]